VARAIRPPRPPLPRFAVAWFPRFRGIEAIEAFRSKHDPMASLVPAHLSLVFPFPTALPELQVRTHVQRVASRWPIIPVTFRHTRIEANEFLFLMASRGSQSIIGLHDKLYTRSIAPYLRTDIAYQPHITVARQPSFPALEAAAEEAKAALAREFSDIVRDLTLVAVARTGRITRLGTFPLDSA
jgi:hypothetical protein